MIDPHDGNDDEAEQIGEELRKDGEERGESGVSGDFQFEDHDRNDHRDHAIGERFDPIGGHWQTSYLDYAAPTRSQVLGLRKTRPSKTAAKAISHRVHRDHGGNEQRSCQIVFS